MLSTYLFLPREDHSEAVFHVFTYLVLHHNARIVFDPSYPSVDIWAFVNTDWKSMHGDVKEMIHPGAPVPVGRRVTCACLLILTMLVRNSQVVQGMYV
jgi:hypothetical protein